MRVKMLKTAASPDGQWAAGKVVEVSAELAAAWIKCGAAVSAESPVKAAPVVVPVAEIPAEGLAMVAATHDSSTGESRVYRDGVEEPTVLLDPPIEEKPVKVDPPKSKRKGR